VKVPVLVYDGDCSICSRLALRWKARVGARGEIVAYQTPSPALAAVPLRDARRAALWLEPGGGRAQGAEAMLCALAHAGAPQPLGLYRRFALLRLAADAAYALFARLRPRRRRPRPAD
jgi:predicted DCC family thiol-disulfide oxidoreductase YuxK